MVWKLTCLEPSMNCFFSCQPSLNRRFFFEPCSFWAGLGPRRAGRFDHLEPCPMGGLGLRCLPSGEILGQGWILIEFSFFVPNPKISKISKINPRFFFLVHFGEATQLWWSLSHVISLLFFLSWDGAVDPWQVYTQEYLVYLAEDASGTARSQVESAVPVGGLAQQRPARFSSQNGGSTVSLMGNFMGG